MCEFGYYIYSYLFSPVVNIKNKIKKRSKYLNLLRKCYKFQEEHLKENDTGKYVIKWISGMLHMHHQAKWILNCCAHLPLCLCGFLNDAMDERRTLNIGCTVFRSQSTNWKKEKRGGKRSWKPAATHLIIPAQELLPSNPEDKINSPTLNCFLSELCHSKENICDSSLHWVVKPKFHGCFPGLFCKGR